MHEPRKVPVTFKLAKWPEELHRLVEEYSFYWDSTCNYLRAPPSVFNRMDMVAFSSDHKNYVITPEGKEFPLLTGFGTLEYKLFFNPDPEATEIELGYSPEIWEAMMVNDLDFMGPALIREDYIKDLFGELK